MHPGRPCDLFSQTLLGRLVEDANAVVDAEAGMLPGQEVPGKVLVEEFALYQEVDNPTPEYLDHGVQSRERYVEERTFIIEAALQNDSVEMRFAPQPQLLDALKAIPAVGCGVLLIVVLAEVGEVSLEYGMELAAATGNVLIPRRGRKRDGRAHIIVYGRNQLFASDRELVHRSPHNVSHSPDAFSSRRSCEGAGDAVVMFHRESDYCQLARLALMKFAWELKRSDHIHRIKSLTRIHIVFTISL
jgi:hypothetical protein